MFPSLLFSLLFSPALEAKNCQVQVQYHLANGKTLMRQFSVPSKNRSQCEREKNQFSAFADNRRVVKKTVSVRFE